MSYFETVGDLDVGDLLPRVQARTLVMHVRGDLIAPLESGREVAAGIPDARFVAIEGRSHLVQEGEPAFERIFEEIRLFFIEVTPRIFSASSELGGVDGFDGDEAGGECDEATPISASLKHPCWKGLSGYSRTSACVQTCRLACSLGCRLLDAARVYSTTDMLRKAAMPPSRVRLCFGSQAEQ